MNTKKSRIKNKNCKNFKNKLKKQTNKKKKKK